MKIFINCGKWQVLWCKSMIHVCFFSGDITRSGGTERVGTVIANELQKEEQLKISFLSLWENRKTPYFFIADGIERNSLYEKETKGIYHVFDYIYRLRSFLKKNTIDILVDIDGILDMYSIPALIGMKIKLISWEQFNYYQNPYVNYRKLTRKMAAKWADAIVVLTKEDMGYYKNNLKIKGQIRQIYNPIIIKENIEPYDIDRKSIISVGRLTEQKGFDILVEVANKVLPIHKDWRWMIIGDGEDKELLNQKILQNGLEQQLTILSTVTDIDSYYEKSSIYVMTSRYEGFGLVLTEAKSHNLPCVSFRCPAGPAEIITEGINGYLVDCFDINAMSEKINRLIENEKLRKEFSKKALIGTEQFNINQVKKEWVKLINQLKG